MPGPGDEIAESMRGLGAFNPVTKMLQMAQSGGGELLKLLEAMGLLQPQQPTPPPPQPQIQPPQQRGLRQRMTEY